MCMSTPVSSPHTLSPKTSVCALRKAYAASLGARNDLLVVAAATPTQQLSGDFSASYNAPIYDPTTPGNRTQFPGNIIPSNRINPVAQQAIQPLFLPSVTGVPTTVNHVVNAPILQDLFPEIPSGQRSAQRTNQFLLSGCATIQPGVVARVAPRTALGCT
jgi:hypothetical protein